MDVEVLGVLEDRGVAVRGAEQQQQVRAGRDRYAADLDRLGRLPPPGDDRGVEAQHLLDGVRDEGGVAAYLLPGVTVGQQLTQGVTDEAGRGLVARDEQFVHDLGHLMLRQRRQV